MSKNRSTIILAAVAAVLVGAYAFMSSDKDPEKTGQIFSFGSDEKIANIQVTNQYGSFDFNKNDDLWWITAPGKYRANQQKLEIMENFLLSMPINRIIEGELPEYGLDNPTVKLDFTTTKGNKNTLLIGNPTASLAQVYIKDYKSGKIFICDIGSISQFDGSLTAFRNKEIFTVDKEKITGLTYYKDGKKVLTVNSDTSSQWQMTYPWNASARHIEINELVVGMRDWSAGGYAEPNSEGYEKIGLDNPKHILEVTDSNGNTQRLEFGNVENGMVYVRTGGKDDIYMIFEVDVNFDMFTPEGLLFVAPLKTTIDSVSAINIKNNNIDTTFTIDHSTGKAVVSSSSKAVNYEEFLSLFIKYIALSADGFDNATPKGKEAFALTTTYKDGSTTSLKLFERDENTLFMEFGEQSGFYITKDKVEQLIYRMDKALGK